MCAKFQVCIVVRLARRCDTNKWINTQIHKYASEIRNILDRLPASCGFWYQIRSFWVRSLIRCSLKFDPAVSIYLYLAWKPGRSYKYAYSSITSSGDIGGKSTVIQDTNSTLQLIPETEQHVKAMVSYTWHPSLRAFTLSYQATRL